MIKFNSFFGILFSLFLSIGFIACSDDDSATPTEEQTIAQIAADDAQFSTLVDALSRVDLVSVLEGNGPFTVFAPTNAAFSQLGVDLSTISDEDLTNILLYHVLGASITSTDLAEGQTYAGTPSTAGFGGTSPSLLVERAGDAVTLNGNVNVTSANIIAKNGVIHVIDGVLQPLDIVGHASANNNFTELVGALGAANGDLVSVLSGEGPFTVFAPLNSAFEEIASTVETLDADQLAKVLTYHVVSGNVLSTDLSNGNSYDTVNGGSFTVNIDNSVTITDSQGNTATVVLANVQTTNGVIHVLDKVIIPGNL